MACEFSGVVRDAFRDRGHDAVSVDLLPTERPGPHVEGDVFDVLRGEVWDLLIAFPPCTYLANSGVRWLYEGGRGSTIDRARWADMHRAAAFFDALLTTPQARRVAIENPIQHRHAELPAPTQRIQPWQFGHPETKATCLWLRELPLLEPTLIVEGRTPRVHYASPGPERWRERSRTLPGIASAMADQWGNLP